MTPEPAMSPVIQEPESKKPKNTTGDENVEQVLPKKDLKGQLDAAAAEPVNTSPVTCMR